MSIRASVIQSVTSCQQRRKGESESCVDDLPKPVHVFTQTDRQTHTHPHTQCRDHGTLTHCCYPCEPHISSRESDFRTSQRWSAQAMRETHTTRLAYRPSKTTGQVPMCFPKQTEDEIQTHNSFFLIEHESLNIPCV